MTAKLTTQPATELIGSWPKARAYRERYFVPDLSPQQRVQLRDFEPQMVFVAESPHEAETAPAAIFERRPLCGRAGQVFWAMVGELLTGEKSKDTDLERQLALLRQGRFAVMNAVQFPLDPKITSYYDESADPVNHLGFSKVPPASYKKLSKGPDVVAALDHLRARLVHPALRALPVIALGNDAQWFVKEALGTEAAARLVMTVPHPSAWWRQGGKLREKAREQLSELLGKTREGRQPLRSEAKGRAAPARASKG